MSTRALIYSTSIILVGVLILVGLDFSFILKGEPEPETYLRREEVRGIAVEHDGRLYTLNFKQQNRVIEILNQAFPMEAIPPGEREPAHIQALVIYRFGGKPDVVLHPLAYLNHNLVFSAPDWNPTAYFQERSEGELQKLLSETYDA